MRLGSRLRSRDREDEKKGKVPWEELEWECRNGQCYVTEKTVQQHEKPIRFQAIKLFSRSTPLTSASLPRRRDSYWLQRRSKSDRTTWTPTIATHGYRGSEETQHKDLTFFGSIVTTIERRVFSMSAPYTYSMPASVGSHNSPKHRRRK